MVTKSLNFIPGRTKLNEVVELGISVATALDNKNMQTFASIPSLYPTVISLHLLLTEMKIERFFCPRQSIIGGRIRNDNTCT